MADKAKKLAHEVTALAGQLQSTRVGKQRRPIMPLVRRDLGAAQLMNSTNPDLSDNLETFRIRCTLVDGGHAAFPSEIIWHSMWMSSNASPRIHGAQVDRKVDAGKKRQKSQLDPTTAR